MMEIIIRLFLLVIMCLPVCNTGSVLAGIDDGRTQKVTVTDEAEANKRQNRKVVMSNKIIEYQKTFYIT